MRSCNYVMMISVMLRCSERLGKSFSLRNRLIFCDRWTGLADNAASLNKPDSVFLPSQPHE